MTIYSENLYEELLINPVRSEQVDTLSIVSGYATSAMAFHHLNHFFEHGQQITVNLIIGMVPRDGMTISNHRGFLGLVGETFADNFKCSYVINRPQVHSKLYIWSRGDVPVRAYIGSANYTQTALRLGKQREVLALCDPLDAMGYYNELQHDTIYCDHQDTENEIMLLRDNFRRGMPSASQTSIADVSVADADYSSLPSVMIPLVKRDGEIHNAGGGLNWGQRGGREPNQAYIQLRPDVYHSDFFPVRGIRFTVLTDDGKSLICTRAQKSDEGQAIETPQNNSLLGEYFRNRLGLANGEFVKTSDLRNYGRTDVKFYKIDDETFYLDFSI